MVWIINRNKYQSPFSLIWPQFLNTVLLPYDGEHNWIVNPNLPDPFWGCSVSVWMESITFMKVKIITRVYTAVYLSKGNTFQKLTGKNGHVDTLVGYNFQKEKSLPASFKPQEILWLMLTFWKLDPV